MRKIAVLVGIVLTILTTANVQPAQAEENFRLSPPLHCTQDDGLFRVWDHLVFVLEDCTSFGEDISPPDTLVVLMYPRDFAETMVRECDHMGGRYEYVALLHICWDVDY